MGNLLSVVARTLAKAFHAFAYGRLRAEMPGIEFILMCDPTDGALENKRDPKRRRAIHVSRTASLHWRNSHIRAGDNWSPLGSRRCLLEWLRACS